MLDYIIYFGKSKDKSAHEIVLYIKLQSKVFTAVKTKTPPSYDRGE